MIIFKRHIFNYLNEWKTNPKRKPLILKGGRQVGKTTLIQHFAQTYAYKIFLNLEKVADKQYFNKYKEVKVLTDALLLSYNIPSDALSKTLLLIDEIQELEDNNFIVSLIRTPIVYGPGVQANMYNLMSLANKYPFIPLGNINNQRSLTFVGNLCQLIHSIIEQKNQEFFWHRMKPGFNNPACKRNKKGFWQKK